MLKSGKIQTDALKVITLSKIKYSTGKKIKYFQGKKKKVASQRILRHTFILYEIALLPSSLQELLSH